jgi:hypothetical protein
MLRRKSRRATRASPGRRDRARTLSGLPEVILKTDQRTVVLELGTGGKFSAKSSSCDENKVFLEGDVLEIAVRSGRWVLTHRPAAPRKALDPVEHYFPTEV